MPNQDISSNPNAAALSAQQQQSREDRSRNSRMAREKRQLEINRNRLRKQQKSRRLKSLRDKGHRGNRGVMNKGKSMSGQSKGVAGTTLNPRRESVEHPNYLLEYGLNIISEI